MVAMAFVRRRLQRATDRTKWFSLTHDILPALAVAVATFLVTWVIGRQDPHFEPSAALFPVAAGFVALIATYLLINATALVFHFVQAGQYLRSEDEAARQRRFLEIGADRSMKEWLTSALTRSDRGVIFAAAFGSVVRSDPTRDADVIVQLGPAPDKRLRTRVLNIKRLAIPFQEIYGVPLHLQFFSSNETDRMIEFVARTGVIDVLTGGEYWERVSDQSNSGSSTTG